jgi:2-C-methyl-D-erythritol 4-phosphate cytidylyltransferase
MVDRCIEAARAGTGAVVGCPATDTLKDVDPDGRVAGTPDRSRLWHAQTPQAFPAQLIREAYEALEDTALATDDASVVELVGGPVVMVQGAVHNLKVTRPEDLPVAELFLRLQNAKGRSEPDPGP